MSVNLKFTPSAMTAIRAAVRVFAELHHFRDQTIPFAWLREGKESPLFAKSNTQNEMKAFELIFWVEGDPDQQYTVFVQVEKIFRSDDLENWCAMVVTGAQPGWSPDLEFWFDWTIDQIYNRKFHANYPYSG